MNAIQEEILPSQTIVARIDRGQSDTIHLTQHIASNTSNTSNSQIVQSLKKLKDQPQKTNSDLEISDIPEEKLTIKDPSNTTLQQTKTLPELYINQQSQKIQNNSETEINGVQEENLNQGP